MTPRQAIDAGTLERGHVRMKLKANLRRRQKAARELADARNELVELIERGETVDLTITEMAAIIGMRREHVRRRLLNGHGQPRFMDNELEEPND